MGKKEEALDIIVQLGLPKQQQNERSVLTLLALLNLKETDSWSDSDQPLLRTVDIMKFMADNYGKVYKPNSRETIRRQTIHQFEQAAIVGRNVDDPSRPTNSGATVYSVTDEFLSLVKLYGKPSWTTGIETFLMQFRSLSEQYNEERNLLRIPVKTSDGKIYTLSPGDHNILQKEIIENFSQYFAHNTELLYFGDTADKYLHINAEKLAELGFPPVAHDKLPDVVLYSEEKGWIYFIEAVTSHGPISSKRKIELLDMIKDSSAKPVFVTAFLDTNEFKKYVADIAWETEVWIADKPEHMVHLNGDRFLGPRY